MAPPAWPMYMPSYMPRPPAQLALSQAEFEELARQHQDLEARELEVQRMTQTRNLNAVRNARVTTATSVAGSRHSCKKEQAPSLLIPMLHLRDPRPLRGLPLQGSRSLVLVSLRLWRPLLSVLRTELTQR